jgi:O-antigen ligase
MNIHKLYKLAYLIIAAYFMAAMGVTAVIFVPQESATNATGSTFLFTLSWLVLYGLVLLVALHFKLKVDKWLLVVLLIPTYFLLSTFWSPQPTKTLVYSICLLQNALAIYVLRSFVTKDQLPEFITDLLFVVTCASLAAYVAGIDIVRYVDIHSRLNFVGLEPIRGFFNHKITAGIYSALGFCSALIIKNGRTQLYYLSVFLVFNLLTGSATGLSLLIIGCAIIAVFYGAKKLRIGNVMLVSILGLGAVISTYLFMHYAHSVLVLLGRDPTLTGRTLLWAWGVEAGLERAWFGWGYLGYLGTDIAGNVAESYVEFQNYDVPHFHNSPVQMFVDGGGVFTAMMITFILYALNHWYRAYYTSSDKVALFFCMLLLFICFSSVFVYVFPRYNNFTTLLVMMSLAYIGPIDVKHMAHASRRRVVQCQ